MCVRSPPGAGRRPGSRPARHPDAAEVVDAGDLLDEVELDVRKLAAGGDARVVDERVDGRVAFEDARGKRLDGSPVADVARLGLAACLLGQRAQPVGAAGDEDAVPAPGGEQACGRLADPRRGTRDHGDALHGPNVTHSASERVAPGDLPRLAVLGPVALRDRAALEAVRGAEIEHDVAGPQVGTADHAPGVGGVGRACENRRRRTSRPRSRARRPSRGGAFCSGRAASRSGTSRPPAAGTARRGGTGRASSRRRR